MKPSPWLIKIVLLLTVFAMSGMPAMAQAATAQQPQSQTEPQSPVTVDPSAAPKTPVPSSDLPEAPSALPQTEMPPAQQPSANAPQPAQSPQQPQQPLGTATAERGATAGGAASKPAGMAIAPAKQKQNRSLLIKLGAVAAAGAAIGIVYGLTRATPSTPPGSTTAANH